MNAKEAREHTATKLVNNTRVAGYLDALDKAICEANSYSIDPYTALQDMRPQPSYEEWKAIKKHYQSLGFAWIEHDDPDPGHPCSRAFTTIDWSE